MTGGHRMSGSSFVVRDIRSFLGAAMASPVPSPGSAAADCCTYAGTVLREFRRRIGGPEEREGWWGRINVRDPLSVWSFPHAAAEVLTWQEVPVGMGFSDGGTRGLPLGWYALQGWRGLVGPIGTDDSEDRLTRGASGHSFFFRIVGHDSQGNPQGAILESSRRDGPRFGGRRFASAAELATIRPTVQPMDQALARWPDVLGVYLGAD